MEIAEERAPAEEALTEHRKETRMTDESVPEQERAAMSARREGLSEKRRALLDALLQQDGIEMEQTGQPDLRSTDSGTGGNETRNRERHRPAGNGGQRGPSPSPLMVMRGSGSKIPFFCVHALLGSVFHYHRLARLMDKEQPFYGLQAPGLDASEAPLDTVDAFAQLYLRSVREIQPKGPYKLGGYSFGSWIAFQMASQLVEEGEEVGLVAILGTGVPLSVSMPWVYEQVRFLSRYWQDFKTNILQPFLPYKERMKLAPGQDQPRGLPPLLRVLMAHNRAALRFEPKPYTGKLTLFETLDQQFRTPLDASRGWKRLSTKPVETHLVSGNHLSILDEPHVRDLAAKLTQCLNRT